LNTYGYVYGNPLNGADRYGLFCGTGICAEIGYGVGVVVTAITARSCAIEIDESVDQLQQAAEDGDNYNENMENALDCLANPHCIAVTAQQNLDNANTNVTDALSNITEATSGLATSVPGTSITGDIPTSIPEAAISGAIGAIGTSGTNSQ